MPVQCTFIASENTWGLYPASDCFKEGYAGWLRCGWSSAIRVSILLEDPYDQNELVSVLAACGIDWPSLLEKINQRMRGYDSMMRVLDALTE